MITGELRNAIVGWLGLPVAIVLAAGGVAGYYNSTHEAFWYALNYVGLLAFAAFVLVVSVDGVIATTRVTKDAVVDQSALRPSSA